MAWVTIEKVDLSSLSSTCRTTAVSDHTVGCGWEIRVTKLNWTPGKWETRLFFFTPTIYFIHFKKWTAPKALQVFWIHSISLASLAWQSRSFPAMCFERRYQESFLSLKLGLVVWNGSFERECNLSLFLGGLPICGCFKDWIQCRFPIVLLFWQSTRLERAHYWTLGCGSLTPANWFLLNFKRSLKVAASSNATVRRYLWITAPG